MIIFIVWFGPTWFFFSVHGCKGRYLAYLINWITGLSFYGSGSSLFFFLRPASSFDGALDPQYNMTQVNKMHFIQMILLQDSEISWKNSVLHRIWSQSWRTWRSFGGRKIGRRLEYEETNSHERSTWRLRTPTICRRSVPALCNAGLPKKKTLQQGKINRKTNEIVLVSTRPSQSILSCYLLIGKDYL